MSLRLILSASQTNMAGVVAFLKNAWNKEPVIFASCAIALTGIALPLISPTTKYSGMINAAMPYNYPVPVRDDGNMPDVPAHPCDPQGPSLEWLINL
ncbi:NADH dehydrogenase [ubiquinone] 1 alpha subcomplex subunit 3-like [Entelurus aequoreus]|uniref:NADH dehydrogenase [ubiquinone] 1 alpha subcomplex subunit 3-like n=1 Tax=Entelurus aequoreus TaxID=161455 RepID=UPI002B1E1D60|nr:NADH dehydrogenase [ubiquinone] 1 alpha subcomplex subunit 3-like [Entelurus aequoreus]XP_061920101.1 NADH dehydrogenase [ubiquinone] 1 alpha subcomplex subunit 3-like [Entelurus aequoreus]